MKQCKCGAVFEEPGKQENAVGEKIGICPCCKSDEYTKISICQKCGNPAEHLEKYCNSCKDFIKQGFTTTKNVYIDDFGFDKNEVLDVMAEVVEER